MTEKTKYYIEKTNWLDMFGCWLTIFFLIFLYFSLIIMSYIYLGVASVLIWSCVTSIFVLIVIFEDDTFKTRVPVKKEEQVVSDYFFP